MSSSEMLLDAERGTIQNSEPRMPLHTRRAVEVAQSAGKTIVRRQDEDEDVDWDGSDEDLPDIPDAHSVPGVSIEDEQHFASGLSSDSMVVSPNGTAMGLDKHSAIADQLRSPGASALDIDSDESLVEVAEARVKSGPVMEAYKQARRRITSPLAWAIIAAVCVTVVLACLMFVVSSGAIVAAASASPTPADQVSPSAIQHARQLEARGRISEAWTALQTYKLTTPAEDWPKDLHREIERLEKRLGQRR